MSTQTDMSTSTQTEAVEAVANSLAEMKTSTPNTTDEHSTQSASATSDAASFSSSSSSSSSSLSATSIPTESIHSIPLSHIHPSNVPDEWTVTFDPIIDPVTNQPAARQHPSAIRVHRVHSKPLIIRAEEFVTKEECEELLKLAYAEEAPSWRPYRNITYKPTLDTETGEVVKQEFIVGHSETATMWQLDYGHYVAVRPLITHLADRLSRIVNLPSTRTSNMRRLLRYKDGQKFDLHADDFDRIEPLHRGRRLLTCLIYIKTEPDETGGGTVFPLLDDGEGGEPFTWRSPPISGSLLIFRNFDPQNEFKFDSRCQHYAEPTFKGSKYVINAYQVEQDGRWFH